jgi:hypothetical protein
MRMQLEDERVRSSTEHPLKRARRPSHVAPLQIERINGEKMDSCMVD